MNRLTAQESIESKMIYLNKFNPFFIPYEYFKLFQAETEVMKLKSILLIVLIAM